MGRRLPGRSCSGQGNLRRDGGSVSCPDRPIAAHDNDRRYASKGAAGGYCKPLRLDAYGRLSTRGLLVLRAVTRGERMRSRFEAILWASGVAGFGYSLYDRQWPLLVLTAVVMTLLAVSSVLRRRILASPTLWDWSLRVRHANEGRGALARAAQRLWGADQGTKLGYDSIFYSKIHGGARQNYALVAPLKTLTRRRKWPGWAFAVGLTNEGLRVKRAATPDAAGTIHVSLGENPTGIYNNAGKRFLDTVYPLNEDTHPTAYSRAMDLSGRAQRVFLDPDVQAPEEPLAKDFPLRWASAGVLPLAKWRGREWAVLFFRDIRPKGWNLANGASENEVEQYDLARLAHREFCEEVLVVDRAPSAGVVAQVRPFAFDGAFGSRSVLGSQEFAEEHARLRFSEDNLRLEWPDDATDSIAVSAVKTRWQVRVTGAGESDRLTHNVIPSLNPLERGVEMTQIIRFDLRDSDQVLDGEILEDVGGRRILARRPVALISLDFLKEVIAQSSWEEASRDRRLLPPIPAHDIHVFPSEGDLREDRVAALVKVRDSGGGSAEEERHHKAWYDEFARLYDSKVGEIEQARLLCPVVWKTLQVAVRTADV